MDYFLAFLALLGHCAISIFLINRAHATALPYWLIKLIDAGWYVAVGGAPVLVAIYFTLGMPEWMERHVVFQYAVFTYVVVCWFSALAAVPVWFRYSTDAGTTHRLVSNHTQHIDVIRRCGRRPIGSISTNLLSKIPTNQVFNLSVTEKVLQLPRLDPQLNGLTIAHLSDLHFTGRITREFFEMVVDQTNQMDVDLVAITGDIIDNPLCRPWLDEILGKLRSRHGVFFILGNHDLRIHDEPGLRAQLTRLGFHDLGGRWQSLTINRKQIVLAGNELPWFVPAADMQSCPIKPRQGRPFRIALSHSPDQIGWCQNYDFDLMLAGHTHGGQIRLPVIGPIFAPSRYGVKYSAGTFFEDPTLMHVSRGLSGTRPLRFNCTPEVTKLVLRV
ncbi:MAG: metallophosphoesterase [Planctomycetaceae bacterium]|nr:metallophosphoesterase [Planctomycetaceae bacterium]